MDEQCVCLSLSQENLREGRVRQCPFPECSAMARFTKPVNSYAQFLRVRPAAGD